MLEYPAVSTDRGKSRNKASGVVTEFAPHLRRRSTAPVPSPSFAWRVSNHRMRTIILLRVSLLVPRIDAIKSEVRPVCFNEQCRDQLLSG